MGLQVHGEVDDAVEVVGVEGVDGVDGEELRDEVEGGKNGGNRH